ncbi:MAG TPA: ribonuclease P protein component [Allosphingosinicella sp.]|nr:ribonuclease P protein component [Allosphingosinicella sp.]
MTRRADFLAANRGRRVPMPGFVLLVRPRGDGDPGIRLGITVTKKIGGAVVRNRMKRRFRVLARELLPESGIAGADHVLIGRQSGIERDFGLLKAELEKALRKIAANPVIPAKAGTLGREGSGGLPEIPASAGMTDRTR